MMVYGVSNQDPCLTEVALKAPGLLKGKPSGRPANDDLRLAEMGSAEKMSFQACETSNV